MDNGERGAVDDGPHRKREAYAVYGDQVARSIVRWRAATIYAASVTDRIIVDLCPSPETGFRYDSR